MQALGHCHATPTLPLGQRRGLFEPARFALDLTWASADFKSAARARDYPSPPMSGSPPLPPKFAHEAGERAHAGFPGTSQDVFRTGSVGDGRAPTGVPTLNRPFPTEPAERMPYSPFRHPEDPMTRPMPYPPHQSPLMAQHPFLPAPPPGPPPAAYPVSTRQQAPENPPYTSPKTHRKTKGHVASACVPCKRAHLRCDAQRPCSRCLANGKEVSCVDVQHKKRGRPRLRDDREPRFDPARLSHPTDTAMRRPMSLYSPGATMRAPFDDSMRRSQSYRVLKSHPADSAVSRYGERGSISDTSFFPAPLSIPTRASEPAAFLTMDFEIAKASSTFMDALGGQNMNGARFFDVLGHRDREKSFDLQRRMQEEQARKEPNYLPPIFGKQEEERVIQGLGFSPEELARFPLDRQEFMTFMPNERTYLVRMGLAKQESIYFIVVVLDSAARRPSQSIPSPHAREASFTYPTQQRYHQPASASAAFDATRPRLGDVGYGGRPPLTPTQLSSGFSPGMPSYSASPNRPDYPAGPSSYQIPRSELPPVTHPPSQPPGFQLPPIRHQPQVSSSGETSWQKEDRSNRVDIGGLIENPEQQYQHQGRPRPQ